MSAKLTDQAVLDDAVLALLKEAKEQGYETVKDYVKAKFQNWNSATEKLIIEELYTDFVDVILHRASKAPFAKGVWDEFSTFQEWLEHNKKMALYRLEQLEEERKEKPTNYPGVVPFLPDMNDVSPGVGGQISFEDAEFYNEILRKTIEVLNKYLSSERKLRTFLADRGVERLEEKFQRREKEDSQLNRLVSKERNKVKDVSAVMKKKKQVVSGFDNWVGMKGKGKEEDNAKE